MNQATDQQQKPKIEYYLPIPKSVQALQYIPSLFDFLYEEWGKSDKIVCGNLESGADDLSVLHVYTTDGERKAFLGDWIVKHQNGDLSVVHRDAFNKQYKIINDNE